MLRRLWLVLAAAVALFVNTGCLEIEQILEIRQDLSGEMTLNFEIDVEKMLGPLVAFGGGEEDFQRGFEETMQQSRADFEQEMSELEASLPEGTELLGADVRLDGYRVVSTARIAFDHITRLSSVLEQSGERLQAAGAGGFGGIDVQETNGQLQLRFEALDPGEAEASAKADVDPNVEAMMNRMMGGSMTVSIAVVSPFPVVETNGTSEPGRVSWTYGVDELRTLAEEGDAPAPAVVLQLGDAPDPEVGPVGSVLKGRAEMAFVRMGRLAVATTEVTQLQWKKVVGGKPSDCDLGCGKDFPVNDVSFVDAVRFANALSDKAGLQECYVVRGDAVEWPEGDRCSGFRVPTEREWQRIAARVDPATGWYSSDAEGQTHPVGQRPANPYGLHDVAGNVAEWTWAEEDGARVARGGSFAELREDGALAKRAYPAVLGQGNVGLRLVRTVD